MRLRIVSSALIAIVAWPLVAFAQNAPSSASQGEVRQEIKRKRHMVLPEPAVETGTRDAERVADELTATQRRDELIRTSRERPLSRPELDSSVVQGIQARQINRALRK